MNISNLFRETLIDATIIFLSLVNFSIIFSSSFLICKNLLKRNVKRQSHKSKPIKRTVYILRGVPGVGKDNFIVHNEKNKSGLFSVVSTDHFFYKDDKYQFNRKDVNKSIADCFRNYHMALTENIERIYVSNVNNRKWMYMNYENLASVYDYDVKIIEILCPSRDYLKYFNSRSIHNVPITFSKNIFDNWDDDNKSFYYEPFIGNYNGLLPGDSIPFPKKTMLQLDMELDEYFKNKNLNDEKELSNGCLIDSDNEYSDEMEYSESKSESDESGSSDSDHSIDNSDNDEETKDEDSQNPEDIYYKYRNLSEYISHNTKEDFDNVFKRCI